MICPQPISIVIVWERFLCLQYGTEYKEIIVWDSVLQCVSTDWAKTTQVKSINLVHLWSIGSPGFWSLQNNGEYDHIANYSLYLKLDLG